MPSCHKTIACRNITRLETLWSNDPLLLRLPAFNISTCALSPLLVFKTGLRRYMASATTRPALPAFLRQSKPEIHAKFVDLEWKQRERLAQGAQPGSGTQPSQWSRLTGEQITARNRYANVEPFASNRIKLQVEEGLNDYINASPIHVGKRRFIATQGPKDTNVNHFYRMVASETRDPAIVVMLTQTHEAGKEKCFQYYPLSKEESPLVIPADGEMDDGFSGQVELLSVKEDTASRSQIRHMRLSTTANNNPPLQKDIYHFLFSGWPDFLVPEGDDRAALIDLVRHSAALNRAPSSQTEAKTDESSFAADLASTDQDNPRIIHCSAGVGRSGTFIALDYLLSLLYSGQLDSVPDDSDPIADTVDLLRQQRMMMVQGESQFFFLYEVLRELVLARSDGTKRNDSHPDQARD